MRLRFAAVRPIAIAATITAVLLIFTAGVLKAPAGSVHAASSGHGVCAALQSQPVSCGAGNAPTLSVAPAHRGSPR
jgi:uncharacterized low-complexity protein